MTTNAKKVNLSKKREKMTKNCIGKKQKNGSWGT
jgi:hypothetical protein